MIYFKTCPIKMYHSLNNIHRSYASIDLRFFIALSTVTALVLFLFILDRVNMDEEEVFFEVSKLAAGDSRLILDLILLQ